MDQATANILAAIIGAVASVAVAWITTRARIGVLQPTSEVGVATPATQTYKPSINDAPAPVHEKQSISVRIFRALGWSLVGFLYLIGGITVFVGVVNVASISAVSNDSDVFERVGYVIGSLIPGPFFLYVAYWAQKRLKRQRV